MADWKIKDIADPEEIRIEQGIKFRLRQVVFTTGPQVGQGGYGRVRDSRRGRGLYNLFYS